MSSNFPTYEESRSISSSDVVSVRLARLVSVSSEVSVQASLLFHPLQNYPEHRRYRALAVRWMKKVVALPGMSAEARDTSIQIFDRYFGLESRENEMAMSNPETLSLVAAVAVLLSSKFHESKPLSMACFPNLSNEALIEAEHEVLARINYNIMPQVSPSCIVRLMLQLWPGGFSGPDQDMLREAGDVACKIIGDFWENPTSCLYAPYTLALASLLLAFSYLRVDCSYWLAECVPDECLEQQQQDAEQRGSEAQSPIAQGMFNFDRCLLELQKWCCTQQQQEQQPQSQVPTSPVTAAEARAIAVSPVNVGDASSLDGDEGSPRAGRSSRTGYWPRHRTSSTSSVGSECSSYGPESTSSMSGSERRRLSSSALSEYDTMSTSGSEAGACACATCSAQSASSATATASSSSSSSSRTTAAAAGSAAAQENADVSIPCSVFVGKRARVV